MFADTRTDAQKAAAACAGADGQWHCPNFKKPIVFKASTSVPIIPTSWTVSGWDIDPANSIGCAADTNSGTSATCSGGCSGSACTSGIGPLRTYQELSVHRLGCQGNPTLCPRWQQTTTITYVSNQTPSTDVTNCGLAGCDPVYLKPSLENGASGIIQCALTQVWSSSSTTLVAAKNKSTPQLLEFTLPAGAAVNQLLINTTHASHALVYKSTSTNWLLSQPLVYNAPPWAITSIAEVNTWTSGDTISGNTPASVELTDIEPTPPNGLGGVFVNQCTISDYIPNNQSSLVVNYNVNFQDCIINRIVYPQAGMSENVLYINDGSVYTDTSLSFAMWSSLANAFSLHNGIIGGIWNGTAGGMASLYFDGDSIIATPASTIGVSYLSNAYIETGFSVDSYQGTLSATVYPGPNIGAGGPIVWGPGALSSTSMTRVNYPAGAGNAAATFLLKGGLTINAQAHTCIGVPTVASPTLTCNVILNQTNLDADLGSTSGCLYVQGGSAVCNY